MSVTLTCPKCGRVVKVPKTVHYYAGFLICKACGGRIPLILKRAFRREWDNYVLNGGIFCNMAEKSITFERLMRRGIVVFGRDALEFKVEEGYGTITLQIGWAMRTLRLQKKIDKEEAEKTYNELFEKLSKLKDEEVYNFFKQESKKLAEKLEPTPTEYIESLEKPEHITSLKVKKEEAQELEFESIKERLREIMKKAGLPDSYYEQLEHFSNLSLKYAKERSPYVFDAFAKVGYWFALVHKEAGEAADARKITIPEYRELVSCIEKWQTLLRDKIIKELQKWGFKP
jgi:hypothetical protein